MWLNVLYLVEGGRIGAHQEHGDRKEQLHLAAWLLLLASILIARWESSTSIAQSPLGRRYVSLLGVPSSSAQTHTRKAAATFKIHKSETINHIKTLDRPTSINTFWVPICSLGSFTSSYDWCDCISSYPYTVCLLSNWQQTVAIIRNCDCVHSICCCESFQYILELHNDIDNLDTAKKKLLKKYLAIFQ